MITLSGIADVGEDEGKALDDIHSRSYLGKRGETSMWVKITKTTHEQGFWHPVHLQIISNFHRTISNAH